MVAGGNSDLGCVSMKLISAAKQVVLEGKGLVAGEEVGAGLGWNEFDLCARRGEPRPDGVLIRRANQRLTGVRIAILGTWRH